jgi:hypothetical protein
VTVVWKCCYGMEEGLRWYGSVVMAWRFGDGGMGVLCYGSMATVETDCCYGMTS